MKTRIVLLAGLLAIATVGLAGVTDTGPELIENASADCQPPSNGSGQCDDSCERMSEAIYKLTGIETYCTQ